MHLVNAEACVAHTRKCTHRVHLLICFQALMQDMLARQKCEDSMFGHRYLVQCF